MASDRLVPVRPAIDARPASRDAFAGLASQAWRPPEAEKGINWARYLSALRRFKWMVLAITVVGTGLGFVITRFVASEYEVDATILIAGETPRGGAAGPVRAGDLLSNRAWPELVESFAILDKVAVIQRLYVMPAKWQDSALFADFAINERIRSGKYRLLVDEAGARYTLKNSEGQVVEEGAAGASIGAPLGFRWTPPATELMPGRTAEFLVRTPREAATDLKRRLYPTLPQGSNFMWLRLTGSDPGRLASTMNTVLDEFVAVAAALTKRNVVAIAGTLSSQLAYAERELSEAETLLENFRVNTITLPSEGSPVAGGVEMTRDPVFANYFNRKEQYDNIRRDREMLISMLGEIRRGTLDVSVLLAAPAVRDAEALRAVLMDHSITDAKYRGARALFTDAHRTVRDLAMALDSLTVRAQQEAQTVISQLQRREDDLQIRITAASRELKDIPTRTIEEMRLRRNVEVREALYTMLKNRYEEARLADVSSTPDISVLDAAVSPMAPDSQQVPRILAIAFILSMGGGLGLAFLLDRLDSRFRYPEQAIEELGLNVIGAIPTIPRTARTRARTDQDKQIVEAFRGIRLNLQHACNETSAAPVAVTVTSPGADDGKSLVCANLALSFADAGFRTLLIDGDIRRGELHSAFGVQRQPGLIDYLAGEAILTDVLRRSIHDRLTILPSGSRRQGGPELLTSPALPLLMRMVHTQYDAIIVDSAPLGAGIDAFVLGTVTANMVMVLRSGETDRRLAQAKLELVDRLPIRVVGAVLNDIPATGPYQYYAYLPGYGAEEETFASVGRGA